MRSSGRAFTAVLAGAWVATGCWPHLPPAIDRAHQYAFVARVSVLSAPPQSPKLRFDLFRDAAATKPGCRITDFALGVPELDDSGEFKTMHPVWTATATRDPVHVESLDYGVTPAGMTAMETDPASSASGLPKIEPGRLYVVLSNVAVIIKAVYFVVVESGGRYRVAQGPTPQVALQEAAEK